MTLYDLTTAVTLQGNIEVKIFNHLGDEQETRCFRDMDDFNLYHVDLEEFEDCEVTYIYSSKSRDGTPWLVIEIATAE